MGRVTRYEYNVSGQLVAVVDAAGGWPDQLTFGQPITFHAWSPTGEWIVRDWLLLPATLLLEVVEHVDDVPAFVRNAVAHLAPGDSTSGRATFRAAAEAFLRRGVAAGAEVDDQIDVGVGVNFAAFLMMFQKTCCRRVASPYTTESPAAAAWRSACRCRSSRSAPRQSRDAHDFLEYVVCVPTLKVRPYFKGRIGRPAPAAGCDRS